MSCIYYYINLATNYIFYPIFLISQIEENVIPAFSKLTLKFGEINMVMPGVLIFCSTLMEF